MRQLESRVGLTAARAILWIDDELCDEDPSVRLLRFEGFRVDCAASGTTGLALVRARPYDAVILDLHLPDGDGWAVLRECSSHPVVPPVLVLTGYGDVESAVLAMKMGAVDFRLKPLLGDELVTAVAGAVNARRSAVTPSASTPPPTFSATLQDILRALTTASPRAALVDRLLRAVLHSDLPIASFPPCADALQSVVTHDETLDKGRLVAHVRECIERALHNGTGADHTIVRAALVALDACLRQGTRVTEPELARTVGIDPVRLGRLLRRQTGHGFSFWRLAIAIKLAAHELSSGDEQIAQICYRFGYHHASQFDRDFHRMFGMSPRRFRALLRDDNGGGR